MLEQDVTTPLVQILSLIAIGSPKSGGSSSLFIIRLSIFPACSSASSLVKFVKAFILGLIESNVINYLGAEYRDICTYLILLFILVVKPGGLMGSAILRDERAASERI